MRPTVETFEQWNEEHAIRHDLDKFYNHPNPLIRYIENKRIRTLIELAEIEDTDQVLEVGCGAGHILERVDHGILHGIDISDVQIQRAQARLGRRVELKKSAGESIPYGDKSFDKILCSEVIEHVPNDQRVIENVSNLLAPQGWLVLTTQTGNIYKTEQFLGHLRHYHLDELCDRLTKAGFRIVRAYRSGWPFLNMQKIAAHILQDTVQKKVVTAPSLSLPVRILFAILHRLYWFTLRSYGPQLMIVAQKT